MFYPEMYYDFDPYSYPTPLPPPRKDEIELYFCDRCGCTYSKGTCPEHGRKERVSP